MFIFEKSHHKQWAHYSITQSAEEKNRVWTERLLQYTTLESKEIQCNISNIKLKIWMAGNLSQD